LEELCQQSEPANGGLQKIEPKELLNVDVPFFKDLDIPRDGSAYEQVAFW